MEALMRIVKYQTKGSKILNENNKGIILWQSHF